MCKEARALAPAFTEFFYGNFTEALAKRLRPNQGPPRPSAGPSPVRFDLREAEERAREAVKSLDDIARGECALAMQAGAALGQSIRLGGPRARLARRRRSWLGL